MQLQTNMEVGEAGVFWRACREVAEANAKTIQTNQTRIKDGAAYCRQKDKLKAGAKPSGRDGKMATPVPFAGCVGFSGTPILTKIGKHWQIRGVETPPQPGVERAGSFWNKRRHV
jgi:hypothetical protein